MAGTRQKATNYSSIIPRASNHGSNVMQNTIVSTLSQSASEEYAIFPIPANCLIIGGFVSGSQPASGVSGQTIIKIGTNVTDNLIATVTVSGGAALKQNLVIPVITVSQSDDHLPYQTDILLTVNSGSTVTVSLSLYLALEYVMPGKA